ncbi:MAG: hypothetical protein BGO45_09900 [Microbacterium sp. 71-36]|uniref:membrane protein YczE n=1 Tax=unclassified Microbacterium TaxID=2609290 RepID=UPI00086C6338|nr:MULTISPECIES: hypothetical protein [unclassified Microbacterium]MBN9211915.1 hypothetical protein [Microbacterium sp.]ODT38419.1 MAG: hypothetical protein ABS60_10570 [Microbacterium sp. SCN 71-17]OJV78308.1 MAG: hypothetical protein BGO45_09900 [Microbacterium sp. 71-36]
MTSRILRLLIGLALYGFGCALTIAAGLGVDPWTVFAEGLSRATGLGVGWITNIVGLGVLLLWIPLRQRPGIGTVANILLVGTSIQLSLTFLPHPDALIWQALMLVAGVVTVAAASGLYIGAHFGPGPRDGLMTGIHARYGWPIWAARLGVEGTVLVAGWLLGGTVGIGTVVFALGIGPLVHVALPLLAAPEARPRPRRPARV